MLDVVPGWQRFMPSGFVHLIVKANSAGIREAACGRSARSLTSDFPEGAKRCPVCELLDRGEADR